MNTAIVLADRLSTFSDHWAPRTVAEFQGNDVMVTKLLGTYVWHRHAHDELFLVLRGELVIELRHETIVLRPGELIVVPRDTEHRPRARAEVHLLLLAPTGAPNSGDPITAAPRRVI
jgi:mannose-6-phosphate isomerase-like protein (cupin superfamily)